MINKQIGKYTPCAMKSKVNSLKDKLKVPNTNMRKFFRKLECAQMFHDLARVQSSFKVVG